MSHKSSSSGSYLGRRRRVRFVEKRPYFGFDHLPPAQRSLEVVFFETELPSDLFVARLLGVEVKAVEDCEGFLGVPVLKTTTTILTNLSIFEDFITNALEGDACYHNL